MTTPGRVLRYRYVSISRGPRPRFLQHRPDLRGAFRRSSHKKLERAPNALDHDHEDLHVLRRRQREKRNNGAGSVALRVGEIEGARRPARRASRPTAGKVGRLSMKSPAASMMVTSASPLRAGSLRTTRPCARNRARCVQHPLTSGWALGDWRSDAQFARRATSRILRPSAPTSAQDLLGRVEQGGRLARPAALLLRIASARHPILRTDRQPHLPPFTRPSPPSIRSMIELHAAPLPDTAADLALRRRIRRGCPREAPWRRRHRELLRAGPTRRGDRRSRMARSRREDKHGGERKWLWASPPASSPPIARCSLTRPCRSGWLGLRLFRLGPVRPARPQSSWMACAVAGLGRRRDHGLSRARFLARALTMTAEFLVLAAFDLSGPQRRVGLPSRWRCGGRKTTSAGISARSCLSRSRPLHRH